MKQNITWACLLTILGNGNRWIGLHIRRWPREYPERVRKVLQLTPLRPSDQCTVQGKGCVIEGCLSLTALKSHGDTNIFLCLSRSVTFLFTFVLHNRLRWLHPSCQAGQCILSRGTFFYRFWKPGEPNLLFAEKCAAIHVKGNTDSNTYSNWNNILCSTSCYRICELSVKFVWGRCPGFGWEEVNFLHCSWYCSGTNCTLEKKRYRLSLFKDPYNQQSFM